MTVVGVLTGLCAVVFPVLKFELGVGAIVTFGSLLAAVVYCVAVMFDSVRREGGRRRLDGGTLLGATIFIETATGGAGAILQFALGLRGGGGLTFLAVLYTYMAVVTLLVAMWQRAAEATAPQEDERQPFVFVLELTMSIFSVLTFVLSQRLDNWEFWASLAVKVAGIVLMDTRLHQDLALWLRSGRKHLRYVTASHGAVIAARAERSLLAEQIAATVCAVVLIAEEVAVASGVVDGPVLTRTSDPAARDPMASVAASLVAFGVLALVAVPLSEGVVRRKLARTRLRKAMLIVLGLTVMRREVKRRSAVTRRALRLMADRAAEAGAKLSDDTHEDGSDTARHDAGPGGRGPASVDASAAEPAALPPGPGDDPSWQPAPHFVLRFWFEFALMTAFAVVSAVSGAFAVSSRVEPQ